MGIVAEINSLEEMCDMMCDNKLPDEYWIFTFGSGQEHEGYYVKIRGTFSEARQKMHDKYGESWSIQYSEEEWQNWIETSPANIPVEKELEVIE